MKCYREGVQPQRNILGGRRNNQTSKAIFFSCLSFFVLIFPPVSQLLTFTAVDGSVINPSHSASNIGFIFDSNLNMERQVAAICESAFLHMRNISCIRKFLLAESTKMLTHAFVMCRLENCNSLLYRLPNYLIHRLKLFQNCATRLILCGFKYDCITPLLRYYTGFRGAEDCFQNPTVDF